MKDRTLLSFFSLLLAAAFFLSSIIILFFRPMSSITPNLPTPSPDISTWKTYRHPQLGFEIKHPPQFLIKTEPSSTKISDRAGFEKDEFALILTFQPLSA